MAKVGLAKVGFDRLEVRAKRPPWKRLLMPLFKNVGRTTQSALTFCAALSCPVLHLETPGHDHQNPRIQHLTRHETHVLTAPLVTQTPLPDTLHTKIVRTGEPHPGPSTLMLSRNSRPQHLAHVNRNNRAPPSQPHNINRHPRCMAVSCPLTRQGTPANAISARIGHFVPRQPRTPQAHALGSPLLDPPLDTLLARKKHLSWGLPNLWPTCPLPGTPRPDAILGDSPTSLVHLTLCQGHPGLKILAHNLRLAWFSPGILQPEAILAPSIQTSLAHSIELSNVLIVHHLQPAQPAPRPKTRTMPHVTMCHVCRHDRPEHRLTKDPNQITEGLCVS